MLNPPLSKAFDTVNHTILLDKSMYYGINNKENEWFKSYLNKRKQKVLVNGFTSDLLTIHSGMPQGSILGPLLFLIHVIADEYCFPSQWHLVLLQGSSFVIFQHLLCV